MNNKNTIRLVIIIILSITSTLIAFSGVLSAQTGEDCEQAARIMKQASQDSSNVSKEEQGIYEKVTSLCPTMAEAWYNLALVVDGNGDPSGAIEALDKAIQLKKSSSFFVAKAGMLTKQNKLVEAGDLYQSVLDDNPADLKALQGLSLIKARQGDSKGALTLLSKAYKIKKDDFVTTYNLGVLYSRMQRIDESIVYYQKVAILDAKNFNARYQLGLAYGRVGRLEDSARALSEATTIDPNAANAHRMLGISYEKMGQLEKAELAFRRAIDLDKEDLESVVGLGVVLVLKKQPGLAEEMLKEAMVSNQKSDRLMSVLGWAQLELGKYKKSENSLKSAIELNAMNPSAHNNLGVLYQKLGRLEGAKREFDTALRINPGLEEARRNYNRIAGR